MYKMNKIIISALCDSAVRVYIKFFCIMYTLNTCAHILFMRVAIIIKKRVLKYTAWICNSYTNPKFEAALKHS
jgi:hypothetical protein